ncbi:MAG: hypothetical protein AB8B51_04590 [Sedimentitalea sp.]
MPIAKPIVLTLAMLGCGLPANAANFADPTWPCVQRKVASLSVGLMWALPIDTTAQPDDATTRADVAELAGLLALRRVDLGDLQPRIDAFAAKYDGDSHLLGLVFHQVFERLSKRRTRIINGIGRFSLSQIALAEQIDANRAEMDNALDKAKPDFDRVDALEEQLDWDQVIFTDRQRNIAYLCETPTLLERRLFSLAQSLQAVARDPG